VRPRCNMSPLAVFVLELPLFAQDSAGLQPGIFLALRCHPACPDEGRERSSALQLFLGLRCHPERGRFLADEGPAVILVWVGVLRFSLLNVAPPLRISTQLSSRLPRRRKGAKFRALLLFFCFSSAFLLVFQGRGTSWGRPGRRLVEPGEESTK
jgi:hypothetical protein